jgi:hypothetical protein
MNFLTNWLITETTMVWVVNDLRLVVHINTPRNLLGDLLRGNYVDLFDRDKLVCREPTGGKTVAEAQALVIELAKKYLSNQFEQNDEKELQLINTMNKLLESTINANTDI